MENQAKFQIIYNGETLEFEHGAQAYIFDYALFWDIDKLGLPTLKSFVYFVYRCYMKDDNARVYKDSPVEMREYCNGKQKSDVMPDLIDLLISETYYIK